jgi:hypothetical protein
MKRLALAAVAAGLAGVVAAGPTSATDTVGTVDNPGIGIQWTGVAPLALDGGHVLEVDLPADVWDDESGGVQVGIRWESEDEDLELEVLGPDGTSYASSGFPSTAESVLVPAAANGDYTVKVSSASNPDIAYEAFAQVERDVAVEPVRQLLPDLVSFQPRNLRFAIGAYLLNPTGGIEVTSCYPEEMAEQGARKCLRFDQIIANVGDGPFEIRYTVPPEGAAPSGTPNVVQFESLRQRIHSSDGSFEDRVADTYEFHPAHAHFHYRNFAVSALLREDGTVAAAGRKNGFCMVDVENYAFAMKGDAARTYVPPACLAPTEGDEIVNGISVGWADVYNWYLADQFIEVSGLTDGHYVLTTTADPASTIVELDDDNNCTAARIELSGGVTQARILGPASC